MKSNSCAEWNEVAKCCRNWARQMRKAAQVGSFCRASRERMADRAVGLGSDKPKDHVDFVHVIASDFQGTRLGAEIGESERAIQRDRRSLTGTDRNENLLKRERAG